MMAHVTPQTVIRTTGNGTACSCQEMTEISVDH